ncbi:MAG: DUF86 domain-containing protein [Deltaproteobacteria bacterium]|nr:DUF86 domain-containing protein [Deltaproteobacteria bacterium]
MVDKPLILKKLSVLDEYLKQIGEYASISPKAYIDDWKIQRIVERTLQMMIETCLDIGEKCQRHALKIPSILYDRSPISALAHMKTSHSVHNSAE